jgi:hypothetical protein
MGNGRRHSTRLHGLVGTPCKSKLIRTLVSCSGQDVRSRVSICRFVRWVACLVFSPLSCFQTCIDSYSNVRLYVQCAATKTHKDPKFCRPGLTSPDHGRIRRRAACQQKQVCTPRDQAPMAKKKTSLAEHAVCPPLLALKKVN